MQYSFGGGRHKCTQKILKFSCVVTMKEKQHPLQRIEEPQYTNTLQNEYKGNRQGTRDCQRKTITLFVKAFCDQVPRL
jgi:hypothetical protein